MRILSMRRAFMLQMLHLSLSYVVHIIFFIIKCGIMHFLCAMHHPHPIGYLRAKFRSVVTSVAELAHGEKSRTQSLSYSPTQHI